jgi:type I restriction enzyme S subunit
MEMRAGYKQTEVGVIPEQWDVRTLASVAERIMVGIASAATHAYRTKGIPLLRNQNIRAGHLDDSDILFIDYEYEKTFRNKRLRTGDLLTARTGYPGITCIVPPAYNAAQSFTTLITRPKGGEIESAFLCSFINSAQGQHFFDQSQIGGAQKNVNAGTLRKMAVPVPPPFEQRAIAKALSDIDELLVGLDRLIAKKRDLKQAAMQQLLTGQTRLPGFDGEWTIRELREVCTKIQDGTHFSPKLTGNDYLYITSRNIDFGILNLSTVETIAAAEHAKIYKRCDVRKGDLLLTKDGVNTGNCALNTLDEAFSLLSSVAFLRFDTRCHVPTFFLYQILSERVQRQISDLMSGNAITRLTLAKIKALRFAVASFEEQTAIAEVLSDIDAEITALRQRREKTRALKQGMMQELLTGKTRLI